MNRAYAMLYQTLSVTRQLWHSPPWQAGFYVEARGHSLATRIGRLLEAEPRKDHVMRKLGLTAVVLAVLIAGWVRVQLVAVAQEQKPNAAANEPGVEDTAIVAKTETAPETPKSPSGPPTKVERELLTFDGKRFVEYEAILQQELAPDRRAEAIRALTAFAPAGYAKEAAEIIFAEISSFDEQRVRDKRTVALREACRLGFEEIDPDVVISLLVQAIRSEDYGPRYLGIRSVTSAHRNDELFQVVLGVVTNENERPEVRESALVALEEIDPRYGNSWAQVRGTVLSDKATDRMRLTAATSIAELPDDSDEFLSRYAREFASPVVFGIVERESFGRIGDLRSAIPVIQHDPDALFAKLIEWSASDQRDVREFGRETIMLHSVWAIKLLTGRFDKLDEDSQVIVVDLLRTAMDNPLIIQRLGRADARDNVGVAFSFLGGVAVGNNERLAKEAQYALSCLLFDLRSGSTEIRALARAELEQRGFDLDEEWQVRFRKRRQQEQEAERVLIRQ